MHNYTNDEIPSITDWMNKGFEESEKSLEVSNKEEINMDKLKCDACGREYEEPIWETHSIRYNDEENRKSEKVNVCPSCMEEIWRILNRRAHVQLAIESMPCATCDCFNKGKFPFCKKAEDCDKYRDWRCKYHI